MKSFQLGVLLGFLIPLPLWFSGCNRAAALEVTPETRAAECSCDPSALAEYGTFRDQAPSAAQWWLPKKRRVPFEILGANDQRLISAVPFAADDEYAILMRVGTRAQKSGDSRALGFFSEEIDNPGDKESQALYGINVYSGSSNRSQLGVHGMAHSKPGAGQAITTVVGTQGFASHLDTKGGVTNNVIGLSGAGQTGVGSEVTGTVHNLIGVLGQSQSRSATSVNQAISVHGKAPQVSGQGAVRVAAAGRFDQPDGALDENHAILVSGSHDELSIGFHRAGNEGAARSIRWKESHQAFEFSHGIGLAVHTTANRPAPGVPGKLIFNTDHGNINIDTGSGWILPDGDPAD